MTRRDSNAPRAEGTRPREWQTPTAVVMLAVTMLTTAIPSPNLDCTEGGASTIAQDQPGIVQGHSLHRPRYCTRSGTSLHLDGVEAGD